MDLFQKVREICLPKVLLLEYLAVKLVEEELSYSFYLEFDLKKYWISMVQLPQEKALKVPVELGS